MGGSLSPCSSLATCQFRPVLLARLYAGLERRVDAFASRTVGVDDVERDAKILTALAQTLQRLADMDAAFATSEVQESSSDAAHIHEELVRRLSSLVDQAEEGSLPGQSEQS